MKRCLQGIAILTALAAAAPAPTRDIVQAGPARIDVVAQGKGPHAASQNTKQSEWWSGGRVPLLDLQAADDPFKPASTRDELKNEFGDRVTVVVIPNASHALIPEEPERVANAIVTWAKATPPR